MEAIKFVVSGNWGHFKRPETNNNPLSHDLITKTALIGMIGAVIGKERDEMKPLFPQLSEGLLYGVQLLNPVKKISWGFTSRTAFKPWQMGSPKYFEFLKNPKFQILLVLKDIRSEVVFYEFLKCLKKEEAIFTPVLGWHNCPANIEFISEGKISELKSGVFETSGFVEKPPKHKPKLLNANFRVGFDKIPNFQNDDFWNYKLNESGENIAYTEIIYPDAQGTITVEGDYYEFLNDNSKWWLI